MIIIIYRLPYIYGFQGTLSLHSCTCVLGVKRYALDISKSTFGWHTDLYMDGHRHRPIDCKNAHFAHSISETHDWRISRFMKKYGFHTCSVN